MAAVDKLLNFFNLRRVGDKTGSHLIPKEVFDKIYGAAGKKSGESDRLGNLTNWWFEDVLEKTKSPGVQNRFERYREYQFADRNSTEIAIGLDSYADESVQLGRTDEIIVVHTDDKMMKLYLEEKLKQLRFGKRVRDIARNLAKFGDYPLALELRDGEGVIDVEPINPMQFSRVEGKIQDIMQKMGVDSRTAKEEEEKFDINKIRKVLLGYKVKEMKVDPWNLVHFRIYSSDPDFHPYGMAIIEGVRSAYRQLISGEILMALARAHRFDRLKYTVKTGETDPAKAFELLNKLRQLHDENVMYQQAGYTYKNPIGLLENLWTTDQVDVQKMGISTNLADIADIEYLNKKLLTGLRLPKGYLLAEGGDGYREGSLVRQDIKFGRLIYQLQSAILEGLVFLLKLDMIVANKDKQFNINAFALSMPFPAPRLNLEESAVKKEMYTNALDILSSIQKLTGLDELEPDVLKSVLTGFSKLDEEEVDKLIATLKSQKMNIEKAKEVTKENLEIKPDKHNLFTGGEAFGTIELLRDCRHLVKDVSFENREILGRAKQNLVEQKKK